MNTPRQADSHTPYNEFHGPCFPLEVREETPVRLTLTPVGSSESKERRVWRLSSFAIEFLVEDADLIDDKIFQTYQTKITVGSSVVFYDQLEVTQVNVEGRFKIAVLPLHPLTVTGDPSVPKRKNKRFYCSDQFLPTGLSQSDIEVGRKMFFRVRDVSAEGMQLVTSLRNSHILNGMRIELRVNFPMIGELDVPVIVKNLRIADTKGGQFLVMGVVYEQKTTRLLETIGQYLTQFGLIESMEELYLQGLSSTHIGSAVNFTFVKTDKDYQELLELRYKAYQGDGKVENEVNVEDMADPIDRNYRLIIGKINGKAVCSGRITRWESENSLEIESMIDWPDDLPEKKDVIEVTRVCTDPSFRGSDLLISLFKFMISAIVRSGRPWVVISATSKYVELYKKLGGRLTPHTYNHPQLGGAKHEVIIGNVHRSLSGRDMSPLYWNIVYSDLVLFLDQHDLLPLTVQDHGRIALYRLLKPLATFLEKYVVQPRREERARLVALGKDSPCKY